MLGKYIRGEERNYNSFLADDNNMERGDLGGDYNVQDYDNYERFAEDCGQHFESNKECEDFWNKFW
ncbi:MAG: hypothetical protein KBS56_03780 [Clostridiales bacterium]|nr:hypothetical protein [Candidatus Crickella equi]